MPIDSSADLLFRVSADPHDAETNIARFRAIMSKDLSSLGKEFSGWSQKVFGELSSVRAGFIAAGAAFAAAAVAMGAAMLEAARKAGELAKEVEHGMHLTGLSAVEMSKLKFAAEKTGVSYETLLTGLVRFSRNLSEANAGKEEARKAFQRLGFSQKEVKDGLENLGPAFTKFAERIHNTRSAAERNALAMELMGRGGAALIPLLLRGEEGFKKFGDQAERLGKVLSQQDVEAARQFRIELAELKAKMEAFELHLGKAAIPRLIQYVAFAEAAAKSTQDWKERLKDLAISALLPGIGASIVGVKNLKSITEEAGKIIDQLVIKARAAFEEGKGAGILPDPGKAKTFAERFGQQLAAMEKVRHEAAEQAIKDLHLVNEIQGETEALEARLFAMRVERFKLAAEHPVAVVLRKQFDELSRAGIKLAGSDDFRLFLQQIREQAFLTSLELKAFQESEGWQGVFGAPFRQAIHENRRLMREWAAGASQDALLLQAAFSSLGDMGKRAFQQMAAGMGQNIALSIVYRKSIGEAMREALAATLASIAAESFVQAIYSTALGFLRLAQHQYVAAGQAFTAAGIFAAVGGAAAIAGRAIAPRESAAAGRESAGEAGARAGAGAGGIGGEPEAGPRIQIVIQGHIIGDSGIEELADILNDAVKNRDVRLISTQARQAGAETA